ncbi:MAG TPA: zf-HC2 domain-containing protein [Candidatus Acidoferrum sp.]|nr:zf-HC2 domain-containing protein [Candidatus Acidoferrum sp.]
MKCEDVARELIPYLDRRANSALRMEIEDHLAACAACHARAQEFRKAWTALDDVPLVEPSLNFNARVRERIAAEPRPRWFRWLVPQPRLALSVALLLALGLWVARFSPSARQEQTSAVKAQDFEAVKDLGVIENLDVLTKFDALSELAPTDSPQPPVQPDSSQPSQPADGGGGDM